MRYFTDNARHLVCFPFSVEKLHKMAQKLGIKRCWFHRGGGGLFPHYDVPKGRVGKLPKKVEVITTRHLLEIIKGAKP